MYNPNVIAIESLEVAKQLNNAIFQSKSKVEFPLSIPDLGFGEGSFVTAELAEMYFETINDWREKNSPSHKLVFEILQKWMRYFRKELPEASNKIDLRIEGYKILWNQEESEINTSGGKTELNDDQISAIQDIYGIGRSMLQRYKVFTKTKEFKHFGYRLFYRQRIFKVSADYIEKIKGYTVEDCPDMDSVKVSGGTEELSEEELEKIAASFYIKDFKADLWNKPDGTKSYELYYGPTIFELKKA